MPLIGARPTQHGLRSRSEPSKANTGNCWPTLPLAFSPSAVRSGSTRSNPSHSTSGRTALTQQGLESFLKSKSRIGISMQVSFTLFRPHNTLRLSGAFSLAEIHTWLGFCLPEVPEKPPASSNEAKFDFVSCFLETRLRADYR